VGENDWTFIKEQDGVSISYKPAVGTVHTLRGCCAMPSSAESIVELCKGLDHWNGLDPFFKEGTVIEKIDNNNEVIVALYSAGVPMVLDREFLFLETRGKKDNAFFIASYSVERDDVPNPKYENSVRAELLRAGFWIVPQEGHCIVTWIVAADPKGWIPVTVVNLLCGDEPLVLARVREALVKEKN